MLRPSLYPRSLHLFVHFSPVNSPSFPSFSHVANEIITSCRSMRLFPLSLLPAAPGLVPKSPATDQGKKGKEQCLCVIIGSYHRMRTIPPIDSHNPDFSSTYMEGSCRQGSPTPMFFFLATVESRSRGIRIQTSKFK